MLPEDRSVQLEKKTNAIGVFVVAGPNARAVLAPLVDRLSLSNKAFPWLSGRQATVGMAPVRLMRVNYVGELGWEIHHPIEYHNHIFDVLEEAGRPHGMKLVGVRAMNWLRLEKSYRAWGAELSKEVSAWESGLDRFIRLDKTGDFIGRAALEAQKASGDLRWKIVTLLIDGPADADPWGVEAILADGKVVGRATGGGWSVAFGKQIAMAFVRPEVSAVGTGLSLRMLGALYPATVVQDSPYDPDNARARADAA
jgi:dimethylglycine dehydrogenase